MEACVKIIDNDGNTVFDLPNDEDEVEVTYPECNTTSGYKTATLKSGTAKCITCKEIIAWQGSPQP
jgi:hypothetical protein